MAHLPLGDSLLADIEAHAALMARGAGEILAGYFGKALQVEYKDRHEHDPVTVADRESQEYLKNAIAARFPDHDVLAEEGEEPKDAPARDFVWALDPLDGTRNFVSGLPVYSCSVGLLYQGVPIVGAVFVPWPCKEGGVVLHACRGGGAFMGRDPISVFKGAEPRGNALAALPGSFRGLYRFLKPLRARAGEVRTTGSTAYELAMTARGALQYSATTAPRLWDVAAGAVLVMEAGGVVMRDQRPRGLRALLASSRWVPTESLVPSWRSGATTMGELRRWSAPLVLGAPEVVRYVTSNMRARPRVRYQAYRAWRRLRRPANRGKAERG